MGNCNSVDPACATLEHPSGRVDKLDLSASARELMLRHPGYYVALLTPSVDGSVKSRPSLLPPDTPLHVGSCYRLISFEDVLLGLSDTGNRSRKPTHSKTSASKYQHQPLQAVKELSDVSTAAAKRVNQLRATISKSFALRKENVPKSLPLPMAPVAKQISSSLYPVQRVRPWQPNLQSISERGR